jgi:hypothetical protein
VDAESHDKGPAQNKLPAAPLSALPSTRKINDYRLRVKTVMYFKINLKSSYRKSPMWASAEGDSILQLRTTALLHSGSGVILREMCRMSILIFMPEW